MPRTRASVVTVLLGMVCLLVVGAATGCSSGSSAGVGPTATAPGIATGTATAATTATPSAKAPTRAEVVAFVDEAWAFARKVGKAKAIAAFMDTKGSFYHDGLYVFAYDFKGKVLCLPAEPTKVGENRWNLQDAKGVYFVRDLAGIAKTKGSGWLDYQYANPAQGMAVQQKSSYVRKVDSTWWLGAGMYPPMK